MPNKTIFIMIVTTILLVFFSSVNAKTVQEALVEMANTINKQLPMMVDNETQWDTTVTFNRKVIYLYTLIKYSSNDLSKSQLNSIKADQSKILINSYCTLPKMAVFKKNKVDMDYTYRGKNGKHLITIPINYKDCN